MRDGKSESQKSASLTNASANPVTPRASLGVTDQEFREMGKIGAMYYNQGDLEKARTIFEGLVAMDPTSSAAHASLGALLTRNQEDDRALEHLNQAIKLNPQETAAYVSRAEVLLRMKKGEEAVADLKRAIELDPKQRNPAANRARAMVVGIHDALEIQSVM